MLNIKGLMTVKEILPHLSLPLIQDGGSCMAKGAANEDISLTPEQWF